MAGAVGRPGTCSGSEAGGDHRMCGGVDALARRTELHGGEGGALLLLLVPDVDPRRVGLPNTLVRVMSDA